VKKARERVLKEKKAAGDSAWKDWVAKKRGSNLSMSATKDSAEKKMSLLSNEERYV